MIERTPRERLLADLLADQMERLRVAEAKLKVAHAALLGADERNADLQRRLDAALEALADAREDRRVFLERLNMFESEIARLAKL